MSESEDMEKQRSFNVDADKSQNQGASQNPGASKVENAEVKESGYIVFFL